MIKKLTSNIPILTGSLIFIGYLNHHFYYTQFDIFIGAYLNTTELIFSFLVLTGPIVLALAGLFLFAGFVLVIKRRELADETPENETVGLKNPLVSPVWTINNLKKNWKRKGKQWHHYLFLPFEIASFL